MGGQNTRPITVGTLARTVRRSPEWVREQCNAGRIPHQRDEHGNRLFDPRRAVDAALKITRRHAPSGSAQRR